jgi:hypothetical protein
MRRERNVISPKTTRPRFWFNYADYVVSTKRLKRVEREVSIIPQKLNAIGVISSSSPHLSLRALCFLRELRRLLRGDLGE